MDKIKLKVQARIAIPIGWQMSGTGGVEMVG